MIESRGFSNIERMLSLRFNSGASSSTVWGVEKNRFRNDFSTAIPALIGIAAFVTEGELIPISTKLPAQSTIRQPTPDILKGILLEMTERIFLFGVVRATADRSAPVNDRVVPKLFARIPSQANHVLAGCIVLESAVTGILWEERIIDSFL